MALVFDSIWHSYGAEPIFEGIYLRADGGSVCGVVGRNGSGKSTLFKIGAGILSPSQGMVEIEGERFFRRRALGRFNHLAYLPQTPLIPEIVLLQDVLMNVDPLYISRLEEYQALDVRQRFGSLSMGTRRCIEAFLVLSLKRHACILDEPFTGLEPKLAELVQWAITTCSRESDSAILIADHYTAYLAGVIDKCYVLKQRQCFPVDVGSDSIQQIRSSLI